MRVGIKILLAAILWFLIICITIVPKCISFLWYGKWYFNDSDYDYEEAVVELVFTIIEDEDLPKK